MSAAAFTAAGVLAACGGGSSKKKAATATTTTTAAAAATTTTVQGASPNGFFHIAVPASSKPDHFGTSVAVATDASGNPTIAFIDHDPNDDKNFDDSTVSIASLDPQKNVLNAPVLVGKGDSDDRGRQVSIAFDTTSKTWGVAWTAATGRIDVAFSTDQKAWSDTVVVNDKDTSARGPALVLAGGKATVAFASEGNGISVATSSSEDSSASWTTTKVPTPSGGNTIRDFHPGAAATANGVVVAFIANASEGGVEADTWAVGTASPVKVMDSKTIQNDSPSVAISSNGSNLVLGATMCRQDNEDDNCMFTSSSGDGGKTWGDVVKVDDDSTDGPGFQTEIAAGTTGAALVWSPNSSNGSDKCGRPEVSQSTDGKSWISCTFDQGKKLGVSASTYDAAFGSGNTFFVVFGNDSDNQNPDELSAGVWLVRQTLKAAG